jgi:hypothetical protein
MRSTDDLTAYRRLTGLARALGEEAEDCMSPITAAAFRAASHFLTRLASAVYAKGLKLD